MNGGGTIHRREAVEGALGPKNDDELTPESEDGDHCGYQIFGRVGASYGHYRWFRRRVREMHSPHRFARRVRRFAPHGLPPLRGSLPPLCHYARISPSPRLEAPLNLALPKSSFRGGVECYGLARRGGERGEFSHSCEKRPLLGFTLSVGTLGCAFTLGRKPREFVLIFLEKGTTVPSSPSDES